MHTHSYLCTCVGGMICNPKCTEWEDEEERMGLGEAERERSGEPTEHRKSRRSRPRRPEVSAGPPVVITSSPVFLSDKLPHCKHVLTPPPETLRISAAGIKNGRRSDSRDTNHRVRSSSRSLAIFLFGRPQSQTVPDHVWVDGSAHAGPGFSAHTSFSGLF